MPRLRANTWGVVLMPGRRISDEQVDRAIELLRSGAEPKVAASAAGMSLWTLYVRLHRRGVTPVRLSGRTLQRRPSAKILDAWRARRDEAFALLERGLTFAAIGAEPGVTRQAASALWLAALRERGMVPPARSSRAERARGRATAMRAQPERVVETQERLERLELARILGMLCGWCGRPLDAGETAYVDRFKVVAPHLARPRSMRSRGGLRAPVCVECAAPDLLAAVAGQDPSPRVGCGRGVFFRRVRATQKRTTCSRRCIGTDARRRRREAERASAD